MFWRDWGWGWLPQVTKEITKAERTYREGFENLDAFERCMKVLARFRKLRSLRNDLGEDVKEFDAILREIFTEFDEILKTDAGRLEECEMDFDTWADKIERQVKEVDELFVGFDSEEEDEEELQKKARRKRRREKEKFFGKWKSGEYRKRVFFLTFAWFVALIGMFVAIGFLAQDFATSQKNLAVQVIRSPAKPLFMPALTVCTSYWGIPNFAEYPTKEYPGLPLFSISLYVRDNRPNGEPAVNMLHPDTLPGAKNSPIEEVIVTSNAEKCTDAKQGFDVRREKESINVLGDQLLNKKQGAGAGFDNCLTCFRVGVKRRELLQQRADENNATKNFFLPSVHMVAAKSLLFDICQSADVKIDRYPSELVQKEILRHMEQLTERGIVDPVGNNASFLNSMTLAMPPNSRIQFLCNVYFFSGFFYPSLDKANISYTFNRSTSQWQPTGTGPYFSKVQVFNRSYRPSGPDVDAIYGDALVMNSLKLYAEPVEGANRTVHPKTAAGVMDFDFSGSLLMFKNVEQRGELGLQVVKANMARRVRGIRALDFYEIGVDFKSFEEEHIEMYPTMAWQEFLTDVFEFIGLFTGVCIFTMIAGSANRVAV